MSLKLSLKYNKDIVAAFLYISGEIPYAENTGLDFAGTNALTLSIPELISG
jgi:hypothetical protein